MRTKIIFSEKCLEYGNWHVESPERVRTAQKMLKEKSYQFLTPEQATEDDILKVHTTEYLWNLKKGFVEDADTPAYENIYEYAKLAAGGAILAAKVNGFSLMRPPGHHAGIHGAALGAHTRGFCYLNNIAIAIKHLNLKTLILDIDGHHGNGTQEIFFKDPKVTFISLHRYPHYPGTGHASEANCLNFPLSFNCGEKTYLKTLEKALNKVDISELDVIAISAGFDTHMGDLASLGLTEKSFREIGRKIGRLEKPTFFVLEGGYSGKNIGKDIDQLLKGLEETKP